MQTASAEFAFSYKKPLLKKEHRDPTTRQH